MRDAELQEILIASSPSAAHSRTGTRSSSEEREGLLERALGADHGEGPGTQQPTRRHQADTIPARRAGRPVLLSLSRCWHLPCFNQTGAGVLPQLAQPTRPPLRKAGSARWRSNADLGMALLAEG